MPLEPPAPDPKPPARPGRIIVPGAEEPLAESGDSPKSRIVLPPGVEAGAEDDLPEYPRLRAVELIPVRERDRDLLVVTDPMGILPAPVALRIEALELMQLLDGSVSLGDLVAMVARESKDIRAGRFVRDFVAQLDRMLLLDSPRFRQVLEEVRREYHALEIRQAAFGGISYPAEAAQAEAFLSKHFESARALREAEARGAAAAAPPRALLVPHLDPRRAGAAIARGYLELEGAVPAGRPLRVVVFGVGHGLAGELFALTRKHFETPFGKVPCDTGFVDAMAARLGDLAYRGELAHRTEHSVEFAALYLRYLLRDREVRIVPILCGGFHGLAARGETPAGHAEARAWIEAVRDTERELGGPTIHLASVDFSHVGVRFGDPAPDERILQEVEARDRAALEAARTGDAEGWHRTIAEHDDSTRICGWGATYAMLRCAEPGTGRLLRYEQSHETGSTVTLATMAWP